MPNVWRRMGVSDNYSHALYKSKASQDAIAWFEVHWWPACDHYSREELPGIVLATIRVDDREVFERWPCEGESIVEDSKLRCEALLAAYKKKGKK